MNELYGSVLHDMRRDLGAIKGSKIESEVKIHITDMYFASRLLKRNKPTDDLYNTMKYITKVGSSRAIVSRETSHLTFFTAIFKLEDICDKYGLDGIWAMCEICKDEMIKAMGGKVE